MLFNSRTFIFLFLPACLIGYSFLRQYRRAGVAWLVACSVFYYGWWNPRYVLLMAASVGANFILGRWLVDLPRDPLSQGRRKLLLGIGVAFNFGLLAYYKYMGFFLASVSSLLRLPAPTWEIILPLAISFHTFQQHAYLVDAYRGNVRRYSLLDYSLFVMFFPQLLAGPIVHHHEMMPQIASRRRQHADPRDLAVGVSMFVIGLAKKVVIADRLAPTANAVFALAGRQPLGGADAWLGTLAFTLQLYFDFSGYSDMAIGTARMLGIRLPLNFNSPYQATSIIDFWRRWHMTLSRWLRDYIYIPLGGNRRGDARRHVNLMLTMLLGGLWHGAGWTFVFWGGLHGVYLVINHLWQKVAAAYTPVPAANGGAVAKERSGGNSAVYGVRWQRSAATATPLWRAQPNRRVEEQRRQARWTAMDALSAPPHSKEVRHRFEWRWGLRTAATTALTFLAVAVAWIFFRAKTFATAWAVVRAMFTPSGWQTASKLGDGEDWLLVALLLVAVQILPNTQQIMRRFRPALAHGRRARDGEIRLPALQWRPSWPWAVGLGAVLVLAVSQLSQISEFIYYQF